MNKLSLIAVIIFLSAGVAFGASYEALTKDNEVTNKEMVQVEETATVDQKIIYTLSYINTRIAVIQTKIMSLQNELAEIQALKVLVDAEAAKVKLKIEEVE